MDIELETITLYNDSDLDILNYPIEEAIIDPKTGTIIIDKETQTYKKTGTTLTWDIKAHETIAFPAYVGHYLETIYGFLKRRKNTAASIKKEIIDGNNSIKE